MYLGQLCMPSPQGVRVYPGLLCVPRVLMYQSMQERKTTSMRNLSSTEWRRLPVQTTVFTKKRNKRCQPSNLLYVNAILLWFDCKVVLMVCQSVGNARNPLDTFPCNFTVDKLPTCCGLVVDLLATRPTSWQQVVVMEFGK